MAIVKEIDLSPLLPLSEKQKATLKTEFLFPDRLTYNEYHKLKDRHPLAKSIDYEENVLTEDVKRLEIAFENVAGSIERMIHGVGSMSQQLSKTLHELDTYKSDLNVAKQEKADLLAENKELTLRLNMIDSAETHKP